MRLINGNIHAREIKVEEKRASGLILPEVINRSYIEAVVINFDEKINSLEIGDTIRVAKDSMLHELENGEFIVNANGVLTIE